MSIVAVTTFNKSGLELYGRRMMSSFLAHWSPYVRLNVYSEGWNDENITVEIAAASKQESSPELHITDLHSASDWLSAFKERNRERSRSSGFRHDAIRFSHKIAALLHTLDTSQAEYVIWVDGDVYTHAPVPLPALREFFPRGDDWIAYLDRGPRIYPECGFYIINTRSQHHERAVKLLRDMYAGDLLFSLPEWHDSFVLWEVVKRLNVGWRSLSGDFSTAHHPFVNAFGHWMDHLKGDRKSRMRSHAYDLKTRREEPYWRGRVIK